MLVFLPLSFVSSSIYALVLVGCTALGIWAAGEAEQLCGKDAACIVIDEITGMLLTYYAVPLALVPLLVGFVCFRVFDIYKPLPQLEQLPGGWGIMLDDLLAGLLSQGCLRCVLLVMSHCIV